MCGIHFILSKKTDSEGVGIQQMVDAGTHRGPDHSATAYHRFGERDLWLGHNRLMVIDPNERSHQPMYAGNDRYVLLLNGEVYNFTALRQVLTEIGEHFLTTSDTEVVLKWLAHYGENGLKELDGMFSLVFVDLHKQQIITTRDRFGIKPLYYAVTDDALVISSEIRSILASGLVPKAPDWEQLRNVITLKYAIRPATCYKGILKLHPGYQLEIGPEGIRSNEQTAYYYDEEPVDSLPLADRVEQALTRSVKKQLRADAPLGIMLSGGVDSSLLLAMLQKTGNTGLPVFTVTHEKQDASFGTNDAEFARLAARQYGFRHHEYPMSLEMFDRLIDDFVASIDQPVADSGAFTTFYLAGQAKDDVRVLWSGAGADEYFGGYNRHVAFKRYIDLFSGHPLLARTGKTISSALPDARPWWGRKQARLYKKFFRSITASPYETYINFMRLGVLEDYMPHLPMPINTLNDAINADRNYYLPDDVLEITDQSTMAHSVETRTPYLSNEMHQIASEVPAEEWLLHGKKWVLKTILGKYDGSVYAQRPKEGFGLPIGAWLLRGKLDKMLNFVLRPDNPLFRIMGRDQISYLIEEHKAGKKDYAAELWGIIIVSRWLEKEAF